MFLVMPYQVILRSLRMLTLLTEFPGKENGLLLVCYFKYCSMNVRELLY